MGETTEIGWTNCTFNPWIGCCKVSPACDFCYAERDNNVRKWVDGWGKDAPRRITSDAYWKQPLKWNRQAEDRTRVFCGSLCDVMEDRPDLFKPRRRLYDLIEVTPNLDWLLLTKRPQNFSRFLPEEWLYAPHPNVWGMTTLESRKYLWRVDALRDTRFMVRGLSIEPLLEDIGTLDLRGIRWVIVGGESGPQARPMHPDWVRSIHVQCIAAGVPFFFKQWGEWSPYGGEQDVPMIRLTRGGRDGSDLANADDGGDVWMRRVGKKRAGRLLDGREWSELPKVSI